MKVLHLISGGDTGGAKTHVLSLVKELNNHMDANIICFIEDSFYADGKAMGLDIKVLKQKKRADLSVVKKLRDIIKEEKYDIVHCHGARANFIAMFLKYYVKVPMVTTIHSDYLLDFKDNVYKRLIYTFLNKTALKSFKNYIVVSSSYKKMLQERGFGKKDIYIVYNGIGTEREDVLSKEDFLKKYSINYSNQKIVGIAARLDTNKDIITFLDSAKKVIDKRVDTLFLVAGEGDEEQRLKKYASSLNIEDNVKFLGFVKDKYSFFNALNINTLTSKSESFPYVILEGAKMSKPIVSTNVGGIEDLVENDKNGYLFEVGNSNQMSEYLLNILTDSDKEAEMGENLYNKVSSEFSINKMGVDHCKIYSEIIEKR